MKMKQNIIILMAALFVSIAPTAHADFFSSNSGEWKMGPNGPYWDESDWPEWTPMYWMEEFMDSFDDDDNGYYGGNGYRPMAMMNNGFSYNSAQGNYPYSYPAPVVPAAPAVE